MEEASFSESLTSNGMNSDLQSYLCKGTFLYLGRLYSLPILLVGYMQSNCISVKS